MKMDSKNPTDSQKPRLGVMIGDPGGVGPEVALRAVTSEGISDICTPVLIGKRHVLERIAPVCRIDQPLYSISSLAEIGSGHGIPVLEMGDLGPGDYEIGKPSVASGEASWTWYHGAQRLSADGELDGWVMGPIDSGSILSTGHLDDINNLQPAGTYMLRTSGPLRIVPLSEHILLRDVTDHVTPERIEEVVRLLDSNLRRWRLTQRRIAVAGINPHASFREDVEKIAPTVERLRAEGFDIVGPVAPDSVFRWTIEGRYDAIVTMYHDQGQIPLKTVAFEGGCTIYMGLPHVMVGVPHGSAYDIAGTGKAQAVSMLAALRTAAAIAGGGGLAQAGGTMKTGQKAVADALAAGRED